MLLFLGSCIGGRFTEGFPDKVINGRGLEDWHLIVNSCWFVFFGYELV